MPVEAVSQSASILARSARLGEHDQIYGGSRGTMSEGFARDSLQPVSIHRASCGFAGDRESETGMVLVVSTREHGKKPIRGSFRAGHNAAEIS